MSGSLVRAGRTAALDFRVLLEALANPGRVCALDVPPEVPAAVVPVAGLADVEVALCVLEADGSDWADRIRIATGARIVAAESAQLLLALRPLQPSEVARLPRGDALHPEAGARLVLAVDRLHPTEGALRVTTRGPGVPDERSFAVTGLDPAVLEAVHAANRNYPAGLDLYLVATDGRVVGLPRSNRLSWHSDSAHDAEQGDD